MAVDGQWSTTLMSGTEFGYFHQQPSERAKMFFLFSFAFVYSYLKISGLFVLFFFLYFFFIVLHGTIDAHGMASSRIVVWNRIILGSCVSWKQISYFFFTLWDPEIERSSSLRSSQSDVNLDCSVFASLPPLLFLLFRGNETTFPTHPRLPRSVIMMTYLALLLFIFFLFLRGD